jgi:hypothetical protein
MFDISAYNFYNFFMFFHLFIKLVEIFGVEMLAQAVTFAIIVSLSSSFLIEFKFQYNSFVNCDDPFKQYTQPFDCCYFPFLYVSNTDAKDCPSKCPNKTDYCCIFNCVSVASKIYVNSTYHGENLVKFYEQNLRNGWEFSLEMWMPVIKANVDECMRIGN